MLSNDSMHIILCNSFHNIVQIDMCVCVCARMNGCVRVNVCACVCLKVDFYPN